MRLLNLTPSHSAFDISSQLLSHITCQLCFEPFKEPRILPCLHSFCGQCLHRQIERSGTKQNMECPTCQRSITIPEGGVNAIPQNFHLGFEVKVAQCMSKIGSVEEKSCDAACVEVRGLQWFSVAHVMSCYVPSAMTTIHLAENCPITKLSD